MRVGPLAIGGELPSVAGAGRSDYDSGQQVEQHPIIRTISRQVASRTVARHQQGVATGGVEVFAPTDNRDHLMQGE